MGTKLEKSLTAAPLALTVTNGGLGVTGLSPTVALRNAATTNSYFDFADNTFKTVGWTTKYAAMTELERGHYQRSLNVSGTASLTVGLVLSAEYHVDNGGTVQGDSQDLLEITQEAQDTTLLRKHITNKLHEASGTPGSLVLYDDDNATPILTWELRDEFGNSVAAAVGTPARRTKAT